MRQNDKKETILGHATAQDGAAMHQMAGLCGLDQNSVYYYLLFGKYFSKTSAVASVDGQMAGFVTGFAPPEKPDTLFIWQVGVGSDFRGQGLARQMILFLIKSPTASCKYLEATVNPSNKASQALFRSVAKHLGAEWKFEEQIFSEKDFLPAIHESERLFCIGPFGSKAQEHKAEP
ncbi:MAG: diaminobutyrate acetyltransferase [Desulfatibacillaceae bacterium]|nr:diaminobutyrate acetyltransferase [Desulfatibacillaceae bacterium]